jgi:hypothetical protein
VGTRIINFLKKCGIFVSEQVIGAVLSVAEFLAEVGIIRRKPRNYSQSDTAQDTMEG